MVTRGVFGFRKNRKDMLAYNQWDSYPSDSGKKVLKVIRELTVDKIDELVDKLKIVNYDKLPTDEDIQNLKEYTDLSVSEQSTRDWYCLTKKTHGDIAKILECGYILEQNSFIYNSLYCKWGYIINLDTKKLEVYRGIQEKRPIKSRYKDFTPKDDNSNVSKYYACELIREYDLDKLERLTELEVNGTMNALEDFITKNEE